MSSDAQSQEELVNAVYSFAAEQMKNGASGHQIHASLVEQGLDAGSASTVVANLTQMRSDAERSAAKKHILYGALWCIGGTAVTVWTYSAATAGGGRYFVAWGAILFGAVEFIRGLWQLGSRP